MKQNHKLSIFTLLYNKFNTSFTSHVWWHQSFPI